MRAVRILATCNEDCILAVMLNTSIFVFIFPLVILLIRRDGFLDHNCTLFFLYTFGTRPSLH